MKKLYCAAMLLMLALSSCRLTNLPYTHTDSAPYVETKDGKKYDGTSAHRSTGIFKKDKIVLGDTAFRSKDVAYYSTGGNTFANIGKKTFATQVATGKINLYKYESNVTTTSYGGGNASSYTMGLGSMGGGSQTTTSRRISYYIQKPDALPVKALSYNNLSPIVRTNTPEYAMLERYRKTRVVSRSLGYSSIALFAAGIALTAANSNSSVGPSLAGVGFLAAAGWLGTYITNQSRLLKTVLIADKDTRGKKNVSGRGFKKDR